MCMCHDTATHSNTLQHTATHCNTLQHTATHCNTLQHTATHCNTCICDTCPIYWCQLNHMCHVPKCVPWLIHICHDSFTNAMTHSYMPWHIRTCHASFICVTSIICVMFHYVCHDSLVCIHGTWLMSTYILIERTPPPRGGFLFTMLPHQEPWVRGPPSKN